jgi:hypothetical protein
MQPRKEAANSEQTAKGGRFSAERGVWFVFTTGYDGGALRAAYGGYQRCQKPFQASALLAALTPA